MNKFVFNEENIPVETKQGVLMYLPSLLQTL